MAPLLNSYIPECHHLVPLVHVLFILAHWFFVNVSFLFAKALVNEVESFEKVIDGLEEQRMGTLADEVIHVFCRNSASMPSSKTFLISGNISVLKFVYNILMY